MSSKPKPIQTPFKRDTTNTYGWQSFDRNDPFVKEYMDTPTEVDPGVGRRADLREQENENSWNNAFTSGLPLHVRMQMQQSQKRQLQSQSAAEAQKAEYSRNQQELAKRSALLPRLVQTGGQEEGYNSQVVPGQGGFWGNLLGGIGGAAVGLLSDEDCKENISDTDDVLDRIDGFKAREWDWKDGSGHDTGVVAQEMAQSFPEAVIPGDQRRPWMVKPAAMGALALKGVQELNEKMDQLNRRRKA